MKGITRRNNLSRKNGVEVCIDVSVVDGIFLIFDL